MSSPTILYSMVCAVYPALSLSRCSSGIIGTAATLLPTQRGGSIDPVAARRDKLRNRRRVTLLEALQAKFQDSSKTTLRQMLQTGRVRVNGEPEIDAKREV